MYPRLVVNTAPADSGITDEHIDSVIDAVTTRLAHRYWWVTKDDLLSEAWLACERTNVLSGATSTPAFYERLRTRLVDVLTVEDTWQRERIASGHVTDVGDDGTVYGVVSKDEEVSGVLGQVEARGSFVPTEQDQVAETADRSDADALGRSYLLDRLAEMGRSEFVEWAEGQLGRQWGKKRDVDALVMGSSSEQGEVWAKYARRKEICGGARVVIDEAKPTAADFQETLAEEWRARYRWSGDERARKINAPVTVLSADGTTLVAPTMLRQPLR